MNAKIHKPIKKFKKMKRFLITLVGVIFVGTFTKVHAINPHISPDPAAPEIQNNSMPSDSSDTQLWTYYLMDYTQYPGVDTI